MVIGAPKAQLVQMSSQLDPYPSEEGVLIINLKPKITMDENQIRRGSIIEAILMAGNNAAQNESQTEKGYQFSQALFNRVARDLPIPDFEHVKEELTDKLEKVTTVEEFVDLLEEYIEFARFAQDVTQIREEKGANQPRNLFGMPVAEKVESKEPKDIAHQRA